MIAEPLQASDEETLQFLHDHIWIPDIENEDSVAGIMTGQC